MKTLLWCAKFKKRKMPTIFQKDESKEHEEEECPEAHAGTTYITSAKNFEKVYCVNCFMAY